MKQKLNKIHTKIHELIVFLKEYMDQPNVKYFLKILSNMEMETAYYMDMEISKNEIVSLGYTYKSMFFPRDGLGDFYVFDSDKEIMKEKNKYFSDLIKELDGLLDWR